MSLHKSLKSKDHLRRRRNVLTRRERLEKLLERGEWKEGDSVFGLPSVKETRSLAPATDVGEEETDDEEVSEETAAEEQASEGDSDEA